MTTTIVNETEAKSQFLETAWHSRLDPVNDALWIQGYRAYVIGASLIVRKPNGTRYLINPRNGTCSCPARGECKHKRQLVSLVFLSMSELTNRRKWAAYDALSEYWFAYTTSMTGGKK